MLLLLRLLRAWVPAAEANNSPAQVCCDHNCVLSLLRSCTCCLW
jgi:hypothetical protein